MSGVPRFTASTATWLRGVCIAAVITPAHTGRSSGASGSTTMSLRRTRLATKSPGMSRRYP